MEVFVLADDLEISCVDTYTNVGGVPNVSTNVRVR